MYKTTVKISSKGQIAIPKLIRDKLETDILHIEMIKNKVILRPAESILKIGGSLREYAENAGNQNLSEDENKAWEKHVKEKFSNTGH